MLPRDARDDDPFAHLSEGTPELRALAGSLGLGEQVGQATVAVARRLAGRPAGEPGDLGALLFAVADAELRVLESVCGGEPLRAAATAVHWLARVLEKFGARLTDERARPRPRPDEPDPEVERVRAQLEVLMQRRLRADFPLPAPDATRDGPRPAADPLSAGAAMRRGLDIAAATGSAIAAARACDEVLLTLGSLLPGFGWDYSAGHLQRTLMFRLDHLSALLQRLPVLRRIADELGRMEAIERKRRRAEGGGRESVVGVRVGGELSDVLPCELALLSTPETEDLFYQRFSEHRLLCLELQGTITEATTADEQRGPAIACVDTSGSMQGAPEAVAKALLLAVVRRLAPERRAIHLLLFGGPGDASDLVIRPGRAGLEALLDFLRLGFHAGTDYDTPLRRAVQLLGTDDFAKADVLVVTDGLCSASREVVQQVAQAKARAGARVLSVVIGREVAGVDKFSDDVWRLNPDAAVEGGFDLARWRPRGATREPLPPPECDEWYE